MKSTHLFVLWMLGVFSCAVSAQEPFLAIPKDKLSKYHIRFDKLFFRSPEEERTSYGRVKDMMTRLESYKGKVTATSSNLVNALVLYDSIIVQYCLHDVYLSSRYSVDTRDEASHENESAMSAEFSARTEFLQQELMILSGEACERLMQESPRIKDYAFEIESARRLRAHSLPLEEEERLMTIAPSVQDWQYELYQDLIHRTDFTILKTGAGEALNVWSQRSAIMNNSDRKVRETGFKTRYAEVDRHRDLFAFALIHLVQGKNALSWAHNYHDYPEESYFGKYLDPIGVKELLNTVEQSTDVVKEFEKIQARHIQHISGYPDINYWDLNASKQGQSVPRFDITQGTETILRAVAPLGVEYQREMAALLDPANGRLDIVPGEDRLPGGGGTGAIGIPNVFYMEGFQGYYKDVSVLIHEGGHVVHFQLMGGNNVKAAYGSGPNYFSESFAIFNELLLADYMYRNEQDAATKGFYVEQFLDVKGLEMFRGAQDAQLEQSIYDSVGHDRIHNADDLDRLTLSVLSRYTIWAGIHPAQFRESWMLSRLMYEDPLYLVNYLYGGLLALKYFDLFTRDPKAFSTQYVSLMRNGFDNTPSFLLKKWLNIDLNDPRLVTDALKLLEGKIHQLRQVYNTIDTK